MAITRVSFTSGAANGTGVDEIEVTKPASVVEDDVLVAVILAPDRTPNVAHTDWVQRMILDDYGTDRSRLTVWTRALTDSEPEDWTFTANNSSSQGHSWVCGAYRGVDLADLLAGTPVELAYDKPNNTTWQCPSMTTDEDGAMVIRIYAAAEDMGSEPVIAAPSPFAEVDYVKAPNDWAIMLVCDDVQDTAGATGTLDATSDEADFGPCFGAILALTPAAGEAFTGTATAVLAALTGSATAAQVFEATASGLLTSITAQAAGAQAFDGAAAGTLSALQGNAAAVQAFEAAAAAALSAIQGSAQGDLLFSGTSAANLAALSASAAANLEFSGAASALLGAITGQASEGQAQITGTAVALLSALTADATAELGFVGAADAALPALTAAALGDIEFTGIAAADLSAFTGAAIGSLEFRAAAAAVLAGIHAQASGTAIAEITGTAAALLPALTALAQSAAALTLPGHTFVVPAAHRTLRVSPEERRFVAREVNRTFTVH